MVQDIDLVKMRSRKIQIGVKICGYIKSPQFFLQINLFFYDPGMYHAPYVKFWLAYHG